MRRATSSSQGACTDSCASSRLSKQSVRECSTLVDWEHECSFQEIGNFGTHGVILPVDFGCEYVLYGPLSTAFCVLFGRSVLKDGRYPLLPGSCGIIGLARNSL
jgi:hypothetical protein